MSDLPCHDNNADGVGGGDGDDNDDDDDDDYDRSIIGLMGLSPREEGEELPGAHIAKRCSYLILEQDEEDDAKPQYEDRKRQQHFEHGLGHLHVHYDVDA